MIRIYAILIGLIIVAFSMWLVISPNPTIQRTVIALNNVMYDSYLNLKGSQNKINPSIAIIDIDERSLAEQGSWPWPKSRFADLINEARDQGATVIAFNIVFSESSENIATEYLKQIQTKQSPPPELINVLNQIIYSYEGDEILANTLKNDSIILGFILNQSAYSKGLLPVPDIELSNEINTKQLIIPTFNGYLANLSPLQQSAKKAGFVTGIVDTDGILRQAPLLAMYKNNIYLSLALQAVKQYLKNPKIELILNPIGNKLAVEKIILGSIEIHTDGSGAISIPYKSPYNNFSYYSATDLLNHRLPEKSLENKLVFIGTSVPGLADLRPTPLESLFPSVEIQANIAAGILNNYVPYTPNWNKGAEIGLILLIGISLAILLPFLNAIPIAIILFFFTGILIYSYAWLRSEYNLILSLAIPILTIILLVVMNLIYGFLFESRRRELLFKTFTKYVPKEHASHLTTQSSLKLEGENRILTILFADIRHFTDISETLRATEVKDLLNRFYNPISEIIFKNKGVIDKYYGDMILAFWTPSTEGHSQEFHALNTALEMQIKTHKLQAEFEQSNLPLIRIGIGINTGEVYLGDMGSDIRRSYTIIGDAANLAWRIEELTKFYNAKIIVGESVYENNKNNFVFRYLDRIAVKGKHISVKIYQLICKKEDASELLIKELQQHEIALSLYYQRQWHKAYDNFLDLSKKHPKTKIYVIFLKRIREYLRSPPDQEWNGVFIRKKK